MPLTPPGSRPGTHREESVVELLDRTNLVEFRRKSIGFGAATVAGLAIWIAFRDRVPARVAVPILGWLAIEAGKNIRRWQEWRRAHPGKERIHPDRVQEMQQQTVKVMSDAVRSKAWFTHVILGCVTLPSLVQLVVGVDRSVELASVDPVAIRAGEWWRLLGGTYLHGSYYHFMGNMSALLLYGAILESKTSRLRLPLVYLLSCLAGSLASVQIPPDVPSIGASGGVVGVIGYLFLFSRRQAIKFPPAFRGATASVFVGLITMGALGFWYIDNPGHAGGAIAGVVLAALTVDTALNFDKEIELPLFDFLGWVAVAVLVVGAVVTSLALINPLPA
jgi:membrane associated rhomboid family serine protease